MNITFECGATATDIGSLAMACDAHKCDNKVCQEDCKRTAAQYRGLTLDH